MKSLIKIDTLKTPSTFGDSTYSYFRKGKLHTVRRVYVQRLAYDTKGKLIGEKIIKEGPNSNFTSVNRSMENSQFKTYSMKGKEPTLASENIFSPSQMSLHEPSHYTNEKEKSRSDLSSTSCNHSKPFLLVRLPSLHQKHR